MTEDDLSQRLVAYLVEADELRKSVPDPDEDDNILHFHADLIKARKAQTRFSKILASAGRLRARARRKVKENKDAYEDKWRTAALSNRVGEYNSAKVQDALFASKAIDELAALRKSERLLSEVEEAYDYLNMLYRDLGDVRRDLELLVKIATTEGYLEH